MFRGGVKLSGLSWIKVEFKFLLVKILLFFSHKFVLCEGAAVDMCVVVVVWDDDECVAVSAAADSRAEDDTLQQFMHPFPISLV